MLSLSVDGEQAYGEEHFPGPAKDLDAELRLYFRFSARGQVRWENLELQVCDAADPRLVAIACHHGPLVSDATMDYWERWLDIAGHRGSNLTLLPELFNSANPDAAEAADGPASKLLSEKARRWGMLTCETRYERRGDLLLKTSNGVLTCVLVRLSFGVNFLPARGSSD